MKLGQEDAFGSGELIRCLNCGGGFEDVYTLNVCTVLYVKCV